MKSWIVLIGSLFLVLFFQNCGPNSNLQGQSESEVFELSPFSKANVTGLETLQVMENSTAEIWEIDLAHGKARVIEDLDSTASSVEVCLPIEKQNEIRQFLEQAKVCEPKATVKACEEYRAQSYEPPYVVLFANDQEIRLGEKIDRCAQPTELCDGADQFLKTWLSEFLDHKSSWECQRVSETPNQ